MSLSRASKGPFDLLTEVLSTLGACVVRRTRLEASGLWSFAYPSAPRCKFVALLRGRCWIVVPGRPPQVLQAGDVILLGDTPYVVASDPELPAVDGMGLYADPNADVARVGDGSETVLVGGSLAFDHADAAFILRALPHFLRLERSTPVAESIVHTLAILDGESSHDRPGMPLINARLAEILLVEAIRACLAASDTDRAGFIHALTDRQIGAALELMHAEVARPWNVATLARQVGMSRSAFSARFAELVGRPPLEYLTRWRMTLARRMLRDGQLPIANVAERVGYSSQSAFAQAFKRTFGASPGSVT